MSRSILGLALAPGLAMALGLALLVSWAPGVPGAAAQPAGAAAPAGAPGEAGADPAQTSTCDLIEDAAADSGLPVDYFTRLIWKESSFRASVVSPVGAQGIAQFMPGTAAERGLLDPFDPRQAIPASALLLQSLAQRFGNLGLAAAAYNAGPRRVEEWLAGTGGMPRETRNYVAAVTGRTVEDWRALRVAAAPQDGPQEGAAQNGAEQGAEATTCLEVLAALDAPPPTAVASQVPQAEWQPWGVQVAGNFSQARALESYRSLQERHPTVLGERLPLIVRQRNLSLGTRPMVHVRLPAPTREAANDLCAQLRAANAPCIVLKN